MVGGISWDNTQPIREELFSIDRLEEHARSLAVAQPVTPVRTKGHPLAGRLADNAAALLKAHQAIADFIAEGLLITPAGEWLLDNYHLVETRIYEVRSDLPPRYYRQLPKLADGPFVGFPRVFGVVWAFVAHTDSRFEPDMLCRYLMAYQEIQPLTVGELWAVSITLRIVLIENLRRLADQIVRNHTTRQKADDLADRLLGRAERGAEPVPVVLADLERVEVPNAFAVQLLHRLRDQDPRITPALSWLDQRLAAQGTTAETIVHDEHQREGAANVTVRNIITSMRRISDVDWAELFECTSLVDAVFSVGSNFSDMDFTTRNLYRSAIEDLARCSPLTELDVAHQAVIVAMRAETVTGEQNDRISDPGYHLFAGGRAAFEATIGYKPPFRAWLGRANRSLGIGGYVGVISLLTIGILAFTLHAVAGAGLKPAWVWVLGMLGIIPAIDAAIALVNRGVAFCFGPAPFPALELRNGIPKHLSTLVAVPTMLTTLDEIAQNVERLEVHHLASPEGAVYFALLSDWVDSDSETKAGDDALVAAARAGIDLLNQRYGPGLDGDRFMLLHRRRVWNQSEGRWIGWERKRGKLHELNQLLRGSTDTTYLPSNYRLPDGVCYVITLDADTRLPRDTVRRLIGKMAHPLNQPRFDEVAGRVVEGYAVLQPRVTPSLPVSREGSLFQGIFSSMNGIDPYAAASSDVYQDLFAEGSYAGKGIYNIDAFEAALAGRVPESTLLSHDLFEGMFARAGLASDIEVVEEFPARYDVNAQRHHRWVRGDWQLLPWLLGLKADGGTRRQGGIPAIGRWKMLDNLRRSMSAPMVVLSLMVGLALPVAPALFWSGFVLLTILLPTIIPVIGAIIPCRAGVTARSHFIALGRDIRLALSQAILNIIFLAHQACLMGDAIGRTLVRVFITHRHLLEWVTAAQATIGLRLGVFGFYQRMVCAPVIGIFVLVLAVWFGSELWPLAVCLALLWGISPAVAYWISLSPLVAGRIELSCDDSTTLRLIARRTWRFFETFVTIDDHMLPPDNFQEDPVPVLAHRTSPTNIGLYLLSGVVAREFGWMGTIETIERMEATLGTMKELARYRGHFYNWYDTRDLRPLIPLYISTVDSGNLAGHLIALANTFQEWRSVPLSDAKRLEGITDTVNLAREESVRLNDGYRTQTVTWHQLDESLGQLADGIRRAALPGEDFVGRLSLLVAQAETMTDIARALASERIDTITADMVYWAEATHRALVSHCRDLKSPPDDARLWDARLEAMEQTALSMSLEMEFGFLFVQERKLLSIGYRVPEATLDENCYDLLASEARLASFFAIAKGDIPARHWFHLGRTVTPISNSAALISWSGSMFEYLMPSLVMRAPAGSLIEQTSRLIVQRQIDYAASRGIPWGISESAYNVRDLEFTYQYSNFGVPSLGLKRGLGESCVVAPYATALAAMVDTHAAADNFQRLSSIGARGRYGFYEAIDFTPIRLPEDKHFAIVSAFMAHHQGMTIVALADAILDGLMRARFHAAPIIQATELLLQERMPRDVMLTRLWGEEGSSHGILRDIDAGSERHFTSPHDATPSTHLLSNGRYAVMLTTAGSGYSRWKNIAVSRWREDATCDDWGAYIFLRDIRTGEVWSTGYQPSGASPDEYCVTFNEARAEYCRHDGTLTTTMDVLVSAEDDSEVRLVSLMNSGSVAREIEITSYAELVLAQQTDDNAHLAFSKLFVETEYLPAQGTILATRRRRSPTDPEVWAAHVSVVNGESMSKVEIETDRARFLGRGGTVRSPLSVFSGGTLSNTTGTVLDPIFALRRRIRIPPGGTARIAFWTAVASTRQDVLDLIDKHREITAFERAATLAWTQAQVQLYHLGIDAGEAGLFQRLAGHLLYAAPTMRPASDALRRGLSHQSELWRYGISGDLPILLLRISSIENLDIARQLLQAQEYWQMKLLAVDLVIINELASSYVQDLQVALETLVRAGQSRHQARHEGPVGQVIVLRTDIISAQASTFIAAMARAVIIGERGRLSDQLDRLPSFKAPPKSAAKRTLKISYAPAAPPVPELEFFNGLGGFANKGREYVTTLGPGQWTPAPWINVIANPSFGFQVATEGSGYTWAVNSRENRLTPWSNDPVGDHGGEVFYLRDEETGALWCPTALPIRNDSATYVTRHGWGYSRFEHSAHGIETNLLQYVPVNDPIKISRLKLRNISGRLRHLSVTAYVEWVLGLSRSISSAFVMTEIDPLTGAMFARNTWSQDFGSRVAFVAFGDRQTDWTGDRREFIGRNGTLQAPLALSRYVALSNSVGAGLDPCAAMRSMVELPANATIEIVFFLGQSATAEEARALITRYRSINLDKVLEEVGSHWDDALGAIQVRTPDRSMDIMLNGWMLYQTLACRVWARSAFYQSSGAYGFRDQLQDGMALVTTRPLVTREHLLRAASRQFVEGDVQHWWLPHSGQGVRTRISDDRVWLAYAVAHYIRVSGDAAILDETLSFLDGPGLKDGQHDHFFHPLLSLDAASLFEHCVRGLALSLEVGCHGLPLFGTGDWNDGMNRVGEHGQGESVWLGWFLHATLTAFIPLAEARNEMGRATTWRAHAETLKSSLNETAWDGNWYRRGYFDNGMPLGSASNEECRIDSIAQSWAVLSGAADLDRARCAMESVERELIRPNDGLALLFTPPFVTTVPDPGYIKSYPAGTRENGGQYTHAAAWSVMAFAELGEGEKAMNLFALINPINHARSRADLRRYKVEPYVVAADIYSMPPHVGRGGWTWYTGAAGWIQRAGIESILGIRLQGAVLHLDPCIPKAWPSYEVTLRYGSARYIIAVENPDGVSKGILSIEVDGITVNNGLKSLPLLDDSTIHHVRVMLG